MIKVSSRPVIAVTIGEPAGIGPEVIRKALRSSMLPRGVEFRVLGAEAARSIRPGKLTAASARIAWEALEESVALWKHGQVQAIVTAPIHKENLSQVGFPFPGHTEFFSARCGLLESDGVMAFYDKQFSVALVTAHCSLREALKKVTSERVVQTTILFEKFLRKILGRRPRLAMAGVNPHAGEGGLFGEEERRELMPALKALTRKKINIEGPFPPDTIFNRAAAGDFDGVVAMYHDQGLIPFKLLAFDQGVNVTLGLPLIRTSPDHGTALEIAGKGKAKSSSMLAALQLAAQMVKS
jgi:4-hydroxythreonine-4-phosphate dehydrogenase